MKSDKVCGSESVAYHIRKLLQIAPIRKLLQFVLHKKGHPRYHAIIQSLLKPKSFIKKHGGYR